jgi:hypothetical protein
MCIPIPIPVPQISQVQADVGLTQVLYNYVLISYHPAHPTSRSSRQWVGVLCEAGVVIYPPSCLISPRLPLHPASRCSQRWWWWCSLSPVLPCRLPSPSSFHPPTTPRAVAREAGGRWCVVVVSSPSTNPQPPYEQILVGVGVSRCSSSRLPSLPSSSPLPPVVVSPPSCRRLPSLPSSSPLPLVVVPPPTHPASRGLQRWRWWHHPRLPQSSLSLVHPRSTSRAVAREAGGGWCASLSVLSGRRRHAPVVVIVGPPAIHPTSSCS